MKHTYEKRENLLAQVTNANCGQLNDVMRRLVKGLPYVLEDFENTNIQNKGVVSIGEYRILTLKNEAKQVSYVYKEGEFLGRCSSSHEYFVFPSYTEGLFETHLLLGNGRWIITSFNEMCEHLQCRYSSPMGMRVV